MVEKLRYLIVVPILAGLASCGDGDIGMTSPQKLHEKARRLPLAERYDLYLDVYRSRTPNNPVLAEDIVMLGSSGRLYTMDRATRGDIVEFQAALPIISKFDQRCSQLEETTLQKKVEKLTDSGALKQALTEHIAVACRGKNPTGWR